MIANDIALDFYNQKYEASITCYYLLKDHLNYTAHPADAIEKCRDDAERYPVVILSQQFPVGFFVLHGWNGAQHYSKNWHAILLRAYSVDSRFQGKGVAKQSLNLLVPFVKKHFPGKDEIVLAVNHNNIHAQTLYLKSGFMDKGVRVMGRKGEQFIFYKKV